MTGAAPATAGKLVPLPPDGGWGWVVVLGSFLIHVFIDGFVYSFGVLVETLIEEFNASNTMSSLIISLLTGLTLGVGPIASAVCNKYGCRSTTITGCAIAFVGALASCFATEMWHIVISVGIIMGAGFGLIYCPAIVIVTMYFEKMRSLATGIAVAGAGVGTVLFSPINAYLSETYGWRSVFAGMLVILVLAALCGSTFRPLEFTVVAHEDEGKEEEEKKKEKANDGEAEQIPLDTRTEEKAGLLEPPAHHLSRAHSGSDISNGSLKNSRSVKSVCDVESGGRSRTGTIGEREHGYLNRKDVFYTGSIHDVSEFREDPLKYRSTGSLHSRHAAVVDAITPLEKLHESDENDLSESTENHDGRHMFKTINKMLSLDLLLDVKFLLFAVSNLLTSVGFNSPLYFLPMHAAKIGLTKEQGSRVLSSFGFFNTVGRVVFGIVADHKLPLPWGLGDDTARCRIWMYNISLSICGILTCFTYVFVGYLPLATYAGLFGFSIASYICLTSVILVDLLGLDKLTNAFGLLLLFQGVGTVFGPPIAGILADFQNDYVLSFVFCGINLLASGIMLFIIPYKQYKEQQAANKKIVNGSQ